MHWINPFDRVDRKLPGVLVIHYDVLFCFAEEDIVSKFKDKNLHSLESSRRMIYHRRNSFKTRFFSKLDYFSQSSVLLCKRICKTTV